MKRIPLRSKKYPGLVALIDDEDYSLVAQYLWWPVNTGTNSKTLYVQTKINGRNVLLHRLLRSELAEVDHADGDGLNNQRSNLRSATRAQQMHNRSKQTGPQRCPPYKGVYACTNQEPQKNPWRASIRVTGKRKHLGVFPTPEAAATAYDDAARIAFGEYAKLNFEEAP